MNGNQKKILVTGSSGQLGKEIERLSVLYPQYDFLFTDRSTLPIENLRAVKKYFSEQQIHYCINCAAYTAVDKAEQDKAKAFLINGDAAGNLASVCKNHQTVFIHISTDYVFDGAATTPYREDSKVAPVNIYGQSKLRGEEMVFKHLPQSIVIRTSWVFSSFGNNFLKTMKRLMEEKESINVVNDQYGCPTYAADLAQTIILIIEQDKDISGIYNYCNDGITTWYEFADYIRKTLKSSCVVHPIPAVNFPTPAKRPYYSVLDTQLITDTLSLKIPSWQNATERCISILSGK